MAKCLNCAKNATYNVKNTGARAQDFCDAHLPKFFNKKNLPVHVSHVNDSIVVSEKPVVEEVKVETPKPAKKKAVAEPKVEPVAEAVAEPTSEPTPEAVAEAVAEEAVAE